MAMMYAPWCAHSLKVAKALLETAHDNKEVCIYTYICICMYVCMYVCTCICMCVHIRACI